MNELLLSFILGICAGISAMLLVIVVIICKDIETITDLETKLKYQKDQNTKFISVIKTIAKGDKEDGREEI